MGGAGKRRAQLARRAGLGKSDETTGDSSASKAPTSPQSPKSSRDVSKPMVDRPAGRTLDGPPSSGSRPGSRPGSAHGPPSPGKGTQPFLGDPARRMLLTDVNPLLDLPGMAFNVNREYDFPAKLPERPKVFNTTGRETLVDVNSYPIKSFPNKTVHQYDVQVGTGIEKRALVTKVWHSQRVQKETGPSWIFDGNKLAWALTDFGAAERKIIVDLDLEAGKKPRPGHENKHTIIFRKTNVVNLAAIDAWLHGKMDFDNSVLQAFNFLDHLLRETPSRTLVKLKRSFFPMPDEINTTNIGSAVVAVKGVYQSIRACFGNKLVVNVDVANGTFWEENTALKVALGVCGYPPSNDSVPKWAKALEPVRDPKDYTKGTASPTWRVLGRMRRLSVMANHRNSENKKRQYIIKDFTRLNANQIMFDIRDVDTKEVIDRISVATYFEQKYGITLLWPWIPCIEATKKGVFLPLEVVTVVKAQRYQYKLDDAQTANMIRFAVTRPKERLRSINEGMQMLNWSGDKFLKEYGMSIDNKMITTKGRLLQNPQVQFGNQTINPGLTGRWDLRGKRFLLPNKVTLKSWGVGALGDSRRGPVALPVIQNFVREFIKVFQLHGGVVDNKQPYLDVSLPQDIGKAVEALHKKTSERCGQTAQMLIFVVNGKGIFDYQRIKKSCDCRWGVPSQVLQSAHVQKANAQYISNVCLKFNAKLGGTTAKVAGKPQIGHFQIPSIIIGADVSHASPGSLQPSMAAVSISMDHAANRYFGACETNGHRVEMIATDNLRRMVLPLIKEWTYTTGQGTYPKHIYYFRDGVSEGQFQHVLQQEVRDLKQMFKRELLETYNPKFVVVVASKRHHVRLFPKPGSAACDKNGNPAPGTLVERDVTSPFEYDFYLNSHSAIQGTARPVHYQVLLDEIGLSANTLQNMIYEQCYTYMRATTPVSLHPAVYYAHLVSNRARSHENRPASSGPHTRKEEMKMRDNYDPKAPKGDFGGSSTTEKMPTEFLTLLPMPKEQRIHHSMWYI